MMHNLNGKLHTVRRQIQLLLARHLQLCEERTSKSLKIHRPQGVDDESESDDGYSADTELWLLAEWSLKWSSTGASSTVYSCGQGLQY